MFWNDRTDTKRDVLVAHYNKLIVSTAASVLRKLPLNRMAGVEEDDLRDSGKIGLMLAVERFDPLRVRHGFNGYACKYIRGEILKWLKAMDWVPSGERKSGRAIVRVTRGADQSKAGADDDSPSMVEVAPSGQQLDPMHRETLEKLAKGLPAQQAELLRLYWVTGLELSQVALRMRITLTEADTMQRATVAKLGEQYDYEELCEMLRPA